MGMPMEPVSILHPISKPSLSISTDAPESLQLTKLPGMLWCVELFVYYCIIIDYLLLAQSFGRETD